jgi:hypothetical protein
MTMSEAARSLRISRASFYVLAKKHPDLIKVLHLGRSARVRRASLEAFIDSLSAQADDKHESDAA